MVTTAPQKSRALHSSINTKKSRNIRLLALVTAIAAATITPAVSRSLFPTPMNTSILTGMMWVRELLSGHPDRFYDAMAMPKHVFRKLVHELEMYAGLVHTKHIAAEEQVAIFLHMCKTGGTVRDMRERFQRSPDTISKCVF